MLEHDGKMYTKLRALREVRAALQNLRKVIGVVIWNRSSSVWAFKCTMIAHRYNLCFKGYFRKK